jgi:hypothetical protein
MIRLSAQNCISYAELCDSYGFYKEADFYEKMYNLRFSQANYNYDKQPNWIKEDSILEKGLGKVFEVPAKALDKTKLNKKQKDLASSALFGSMDLADIATSGPEAIKGARKAKELLNIAKSNPGAAKTVEKTIEQVATKVPIFKKLMGSLPFIGILVNLYMSRKDIAKYFDLINQGRFNEIWNDAEERAKFIELVLLTIASAITIPPVVAIPVYGQIFGAVGAALYAFSSASSLGRSGIDAFLRWSGEKDDTLEEISKEDFSLKADINTLIQQAPEAVKQAASVVAKYLMSNPTARWPEITSYSEMKKFTWLNGTSPEARLYTMKLMQIINVLRQMAGNKLKRKKTTPVNTTKPNLQTQITSQNPATLSQNPATLSQKPETPLVTSQKPTDIKMYLGYGYSLYTRTKNYNKSLSELKHKLQADKVPLNDQTTIINKFNEMF